MRLEHMSPNVCKSFQKMIFSPFNFHLFLNQGKIFKDEGGFKIMNFGQTALKIHSDFLPLLKNPSTKHRVEMRKGGLKIT
jgi:hypothetical protein